MGLQASVHTVTTGKTLDTHTTFKSRLPWGLCKDVSNVKDCDVILAFCPVQSRVGTDIEAALRDIPEGKPLVLVVLHQTIDSNYTVPDTKRFIRRPNTITVDCLFTDDGLTRGPHYDDAVRDVTGFLRQHGKRSLRGVLALLGLVLLVAILCLVCDKTITTNVLDKTTMTNMSAKTNRTKVLQSIKLFQLFYVKYKTKQKCIMGVWGRPQCQPRSSAPIQRPYITTAELINRVKTELETKMQQDKQTFEEEINSLKKRVQCIEVQNRKLTKRLQQCLQTCLTIKNAEKDTFSLNSLGHLVTWVLQGGTKKQEDKSQKLKMGALNKKNHLKEGNEKMVEKNKQPGKKGATCICEGCTDSSDLTDNMSVRCSLP